jgi:LmbE family N-acetylglucosaminyl deacetylase
MHKNILVVAAHPDDEVLGCGGTIARHVADGDVVTVVFMSDGVTSRDGSNKDDLVLRRRACAAAQTILGIRECITLDYPDNRLDAFPILEIVQKLEPVIERIAPEIVYTHFAGDLNVDHRVTNQVVLTACRPLPGATVREIYAFEVVSSTEWNPSAEQFAPQVFIDISDQLGKKLDALDAYGMEVRPSPHSRSREHVHSLAAHRGLGIGVAYAESFVALRLIK